MLGLSSNNHIGANLFSYCNNNPVNVSDPSGHWGLPLWAKIAIGITGIVASVALTVATGGAALPALIASLQFVSGSVAISMAIQGLIGYLTGGISGLKNGLLNGAEDGFMWGGIGAAVSAAINAIKIIRAARAGKALDFTKHGFEQAMGRDGGRGVTDAAIRHTLKNPIKVVPQKNGVSKYVGSQSVVVINEKGKIITTWAKSSKYWR